MAGKSFALAIVFGLGTLALAGCPSTISQKANSGKDYRTKGAKKIKKDGETRWRSSRDVVTYPGGDRVDWKVLEIPEESPRGSLAIKVKFDVPRPKLDLAFDVFDAYNHRIGRAKPSKGEDLREREMKANTKEVKLDNVGPGKYFVMVYAPRRTDAARYRVTAKFIEKKIATGGGGPTSDDIPDPPKLPAVPDVEPPPDVEVPKEEPCPNDPSRMKPDCEEIKEVEPVKTRITKITISAKGGVVIRIGQGSKKGIAKGWTGNVVDGSGNPIEGGDFTVYTVKPGYSTAKVSLSVDQVKANKRVIVKPAN